MYPISVVIPTFNSATFIQRTLDFVLRQSLPPLEIIVVNDCSTDATCSILANLASNAAVPLRIIKTERNTGGPAVPSNLGIAAARGELIALLDHDDLMEPHRLKAQHIAFAECPDVGLVLGRCVADESAADRLLLPERGWAALSTIPARCIAEGASRIEAKDAYAGLIRDGCFALTCSNFLFPKRVWSMVGGFDPGIKTACDFDFLEKACRHFDIAYVHAAITTWTAPPITLYSQSSLRRRLQDEWAVLSRCRRCASDGATKIMAGKRQRDFLLTAAYSLRQQGLYRSAAGYLLKSLLRRPNVGAAWDLAKLFPHVFRKLANRGPTS